jgi:zinc transport system substrate-binding protein
MCSIKRLVIVITGILLLLGGNVSAADKLPVFVSIVPQKYFVQQIGKDLVDTQVMVQPGHL